MPSCHFVHLILLSSGPKVPNSGPFENEGIHEIAVMKMNWPSILLLLAVIVLSGFPAYILNGWASVIVSCIFSFVSTIVGYFAFTKLDFAGFTPRSRALL